MMVSLTEIQNRLQPSFTAEQANLIANLHLEMHDQLVTKHDFAELKDVVERLASSQQELAKAQHRTEQRVEELAEAQHRTEQRVEELAEAQHRTEQRVEELAEAQHRTEQRVEELAEAQHRTEHAITELAMTVNKAEHAITELATTVNKAEHAIKDLAKQVGGLAATAGGNLEAYASERIPEVLAERLGFIMESCGSEAIRAGAKSYEFDAVIRGTIGGRETIVLCEVKTNISEAEVRGFLRVVDRVRTVLEQQASAADVRALFFGYRAAVVTQKLVADNGAWLVFPRGLVAAA